jgi:hypothetical protein
MVEPLATGNHPMRRDDVAVKRTAHTMLCDSTTVALWHVFSDELRDALVDSAVMDAVRLSDDESTIRTCQLIAFRERLVEMLGDGVMIGKTRRGLRFDRDRDDKREVEAYERGHLAGREQERAKQ